MAPNQPQERLIQIGTRYFQNEVRPRIEALQSGLIDRAMFALSGSTAYGCCDELSDIEMELFLRPGGEPEISQKIAEILSSHAEYEGVRISPDLTSWKLGLLLDGKLDEFWQDYDPYQLFEITHALPVWDPLGIMPAAAAKIPFYPEPLCKRVLGGLWITVNDSGCYNAEYAIRRNNPTGGSLFLFRGLEALLRLVYVVNRRYYPHSKWLCAGLSGLSNDFGAAGYLERINTGTLPERHGAFCQFVKRLELFLLAHEELMNPEDVLNPWALLSKPYYVHGTF